MPVPVSVAPSRAVFVSYASQDVEPARRICEQLRAAGLEVWFDAAGGLEHGDAWDAKIRKQIRECALFIPLISATTQARHEGYFRIEWELAAERAMGIAVGIPFILPVVIDGTAEPEALVPDRFRRVQWMRLPGGAMPAGVVERLRQLWEKRVSGVSPATANPPSDRPSGSGRRLAALVFTEIVGYAQQLERDATGTLSLMKADAAFMTDRCGRHGGEVLNALGDGLLVSFGSSVAAAAWALEVQSEFLRRKAHSPAAPSLEHRMGAHLGEVSSEPDGSVAGEVVQIAAQLRGQAPAGGLCVSHVVYASIKGQVPMESACLGSKSLASSPEPLVLWQLAPAGSTVLSASARPAASGGATPPEAARPPAIPDYELLRPIGQGAYGEVWLARGITGAYRAVKIVRRERFPDAEPFEREFQGLKTAMSGPLAAAGGLALLHVGRNEQAGYFYYVMELADDAESGRSIDPARYQPLTLKEFRLRRAHRTITDCVALGVSLARELAVLHDHGLVHRDVKPSNVILVGGVAKLADIGLVAASAEAHTLVGTEGYIPPEGPGTPAADVFAAGKVLYELATGLDRKDYPRIPSDLAREERPAFFALNEVIMRACDPDARKRYRDARELLADLERLAAGSQPTSRRPSLTPWIAAGVLAAAAAVAFVFRPASNHAPAAPIAATAAVATKAPESSAAPAKSIAVLPFQNLSEEKEMAYFAAGVHEDTLALLPVIRDLQVTSRTSVLQYQNTTKPIRQIAAELGVTYILEGTVRRAGDTVRVTGQLIDARTDRHLWAKSYNRRLSDIFAIQAELAQEIARSLSAVITPQEKSRLESAPTKNPEAYDRYLAARVATDPKQEEQHLREAVQLDPEFAAAWAALCRYYSFRYFNVGADRTPETLAQAQQALDTVLRLDPESAAALTAQGNFQYYAREDYEKAETYFKQALAIGGPTSEILTSLGFIHRRLGHWPEAIASLRHAAKLDPNDADLAGHLAGVLDAVRRYDEAGAHWRRAAALQPKKTGPRYLSILIEFWAHGSVEKIDAWFATQSYFPPDSEEFHEMRRSWLRQSGRFVEAIAYEREHPRREATTGRGRTNVNEIMDLHHTGDTAAARARAEELLPQLLANPAWERNLNLRRNTLYLQALLGRREDVIRDGKKLFDFRRPDAWVDPASRSHYAGCLALVGEHELALQELAACLRIPYGGHVHGYRYNANWRALRDDPRFLALLNDPRNNAPLF